MKRAALWVGLAVLLAISVDVLGDLTQDRPDRVVAGSRSEVVLEVRERDVHSTLQEAADSVWAVCQGTVHNKLVPPGLVPLSDGQFGLTLKPAVGKHSWRRLKGCLEDMNVDEVRATVLSKSDVLH